MASALEELKQQLLPPALLLLPLLPLLPMLRVVLKLLWPLDEATEPWLLRLGCLRALP
jgi:hypothetical protein